MDVDPRFATSPGSGAPPDAAAGAMGDLRAVCPALLVAAPASGQGKTLVSAALARHHQGLGRTVRVFKAGPDFLDPMVLEAAARSPVHNLDLQLLGADECARVLARAAMQADLILVEAAMGLFDGQPSGADLAVAFDIPVLVVIDASAMAQTFGAVALGLASYRDDVRVHGVLANRVAGSAHAAMLRDSLGAKLRWAGFMPACADAALPERHLGLVQAAEIDDLDRRLDAVADALRFEGALPRPVVFEAPAQAPVQALLRGRRVAVARDAAFSFIHCANVHTLRALGAELVYFSPLSDPALPDCDALWLPGGYPELHLQALAANLALRDAIRAHHAAGRPILAECGGMLYLCEALRDAGGRSAELVGLMPARAEVGPRLAALGQQSVRFDDGELRGHTFHHSTLATALQPWTRATSADGGRGEAVWRIGALTASYVHFYFPSHPRATARLFMP